MRTYVVWCPDLGQEQEDGATIRAQVAPGRWEDTSNLRQNGWRDGYPLQNGHKCLDRSSRESTAPTLING